jgi:hypothetical protein
VQGALQWLEDNQDKSLEDIKAPATKAGDGEDNPNELPPNLLEGEVAKSLVCDECGKKFRSHAQANFHGEKMLDSLSGSMGRSCTMLTSVFDKGDIKVFLNQLRRFHRSQKKSKNRD